MPEEPTDRTDPVAEALADLPAPADVVWELLTSPDGVDAWLGDGSSLPPVEGADLDVADIETGVRRLGRVEDVQPGRRLGFVWWPADGDDGLDASRVVVELRPHDGGTVIEVTESPLPGHGATRARASVATAAWPWRLAALELRLLRALLCVGRSG